MKIPYEKPMLAVERYALTQSIADCSTKIGFLNSQCVIDDVDSTPHMRDLANDQSFISGYCTDPVTTGDDENGVCYHTNANSYFSS